MSPPLIKRPTKTMLLYEANIIISLDNKHNLNVIKDRYTGIVKDLSMSEAIEKIADILVIYVFKGRMTMFQDAMKTQLIKRITNIIATGIDATAKGENKNENPIQRKSRVDGFKHNKLA